ncbi:MAG: TRAP transporter substrate-binding protein [Burkholderiales bacterium]
MPRITSRLVPTLAAMLAALPAAAQDKTFDLKFSSWVPPAHAMHVSVKEWGDSIAKATNGTVKVTLYPSQQLGKADDHHNMARDGIADVTYIALGYQAGRLPMGEAGNLPFLMTNADGGSRAFDEWYRKYSVKELADVKMCLAFVHDPGALHAKKRIVLPEEFKGMKIRSAHGTLASYVTSLGGTNVRVSAPEARQALESGAADAITFPWESILLFGIDKVVNYHMDVPLYVSSFAWLINKDKYNQMSAAQKKAIDAHCNNEWAGRVGKTWGDYEAGGRAKIKALPGHTVYALTPEQTAAWRKAADPVYRQWADNARKTGYDPDKALGELRAALKKYNSDFK